jgi:hypothetical protein
MHAFVIHRRRHLSHAGRQAGYSAASRPGGADITARAER